MTQRRLVIAVLAAVLAGAFTGACAGPSGSSIAAKRQAARYMRAQTLDKLYQIHPIAREQIANAAGYGVFSNVGVNIFWVSAAGGWGVVRDRASGADVYMNMASGGLGLGLGAKDFRGVFIFTTKAALDSFMDHGWSASGQADAAAKSDDKGGSYAGAIDVAPGIKLYQITETGLALQATIQGTKYWRDDELN